jgi:hypothetical protein
MRWQERHDRLTNRPHGRGSELGNREPTAPSAVTGLLNAFGICGGNHSLTVVAR